MYVYTYIHWYILILCYLLLLSLFSPKFETLNPFKRKKEVVEIQIEKQNLECSILQGLYVQIETGIFLPQSYIHIHTLCRILHHSYSFEWGSSEASSTHHQCAVVFKCRRKILELWINFTETRRCQPEWKVLKRIYLMAVQGKKNVITNF